MKMLLSPLVMALVGGLLLTVSALAQTSRYEDTIPPEILKQFDPAIVAGLRPKIVTITQPMIWSLRDKTNHGGDSYDFDLDPKKLSTAQSEIIRQWVRSGVNILFWGANSGLIYARLFDDEIGISWMRPNRYRYTKSYPDHPVNTEVRDVKFSKLRINMWDYVILSKYPVDTEVILSVRDGVLAGRVPYGRGNIYFALFGESIEYGADKDRWILNFRQWMLGLPVPAVANRPPHELRGSCADLVRRLLNPKC